jgi:hypothetical protein
MPGFAAVLSFLQQEDFHLIGVAFATFLYLLVDFFIVIKAFRAILHARSFWLLWFCTFILNILAFEALSKTQDPKAANFGPAQTLALVVMSTLGTAVILQSFTFKIGDRKVVDISKIMDDFRATVLEDISRQAGIAARKFAVRAAEELSAVFKDRPAELRNAFVNVMLFGGRDAQQVKADLTRIEQDARALGVPEEMLLGQKIAQADVGEAQRLAWRT